MGQLRNIKSLNLYVRMMQVFMVSMPPSERDEACQEVRQHLEALVEDFQAEGHSPEEAVGLAVERFGNPGKVGADIRAKWEANRKNQGIATRSEWIRQRKLLKLLKFLATSILLGVIAWGTLVGGVWLPVQAWCAFGAFGTINAILSGTASAYTDEPGGYRKQWSEADWAEERARLQQSQATYQEKISGSTDARTKLTLRIGQGAIDSLLRGMEPFAVSSPGSARLKTLLRLNLLLVAVFAVLSAVTHGKDLFLTFMLLGNVFAVVERVTEAIVGRMLTQRRTT